MFPYRLTSVYVYGIERLWMVVQIWEGRVFFGVGRLMIDVDGWVTIRLDLLCLRPTLVEGRAFAVHVVV